MTEPSVAQIAEGCIYRSHQIDNFTKLSPIKGREIAPNLIPFIIKAFAEALTSERQKMEEAEELVKEMQSDNFKELNKFLNERICEGALDKIKKLESKLEKSEQEIKRLGRDMMEMIEQKVLAEKRIKELEAEKDILTNKEEQLLNNLADMDGRYDRLQAENKALRDEVAKSHQYVRDHGANYRGEIESLRAELARKADKDIPKDEVIEGWKQAWRGGISYGMNLSDKSIAILQEELNKERKRIEALSAELARKTEALKKIESGHPADSKGPTVIIRWTQEIAHQALSSEGGKG